MHPMSPSDGSEYSKQYQAMKNRLFLFHLVSNFLVLIVMLISGLSCVLRDLAGSFRADVFSINALYLFFFSIITSCIFFPLNLYEGYILEHRYGLSRQKLADWIKEELKKGSLTFIIFLIVIEAVYFFLFKYSNSWWIWAAGFWFMVSVVLTKITPNVILPIFFKSTPLKDSPLRDRIFKLLLTYGVRLKEVFVLDFSKKTVKANAMVAGLGRTKQIFLSDTLVSDFSSDEIEVVLAHELGHYLKRDTLKLVMVSLCFAVVSFFCADILLGKLMPIFGFKALSDIAGLPLLLLVLLVVGLISLPMQNGFSRTLERRADMFALTVTKNKAAFISLMERLGKKNLADFEPSKFIEIFLYDHPPLAARIKMAREYNG